MVCAANIPYNQEKPEANMLELARIGRQIAVLRKEKGLTGEKLAEIVGVSPQAVSKWENGKCLPESALLPELANALGISIDTLLMPNSNTNKHEPNEKVESFYEKVNEDSRLEQRSIEFDRSKNIISRYLNDKYMEIADIGGGTGPYSFWLAGKGHNAHLLDLTPKHINQAKKKAKEANIELASYTCGDARALPYKDESMDIVLIMGALYHLQSYESRMKCLAEGYQVLKKGGHIICTVINGYNIFAASIIWNLFLNDLGTLEQAIKTGMADCFTLPQAYSHTPREILAELSNAGFETPMVLAVEGIASAFGDYTWPTDEKESARLKKCIELSESIPELIGVSRNVMAVGRKSPVL